jgi:hypothetical protein
VTFHTSLRGHDTLASIMAHQAEMERRLHEDQAVAARRVVINHGDKQQWPTEDVTEVLAALGLEGN